MLQEQHAAALALFVAAGLTDLADGYLARRWNLKTVVGSVIDPMADKTLMTILTVTLAMKGLLPGLCPPLALLRFIVELTPCTLCEDAWRLNNHR